jgi:PII-like signaling protein
MLLRVFVGERARRAHRPLYEAIVQAARESGLAGATVLRGRRRAWRRRAGLGARHRLG